MAAPYLGAGTTITFPASAFTARIEDINLCSPTRDDIQTTHMGSAYSTSPVDASYTVWNEYIPGNAEAGECSYDIHYDYGVTIPIDGPVETIVVAGRGGAWSFTCDGYIKSCPITVPMKDKMMSTITIKWSGVPVWA